MSDTISANDQKLIEKLQKLLDQVADIRRDLESREFMPRNNGCVCEGTALCSHHADVYNSLQGVSDDLAMAIHKAGRIE